MRPTCFRMSAVLLLTIGAAQAQTMPHDMQAMHGHMHGGGILPPVARHVEAPPNAASVALPELGVEIVAIHLSAAGNLVDLRYRVVDTDKAKPLVSAAMPTVLIDPRSGAEGQVPVDEKVGALRQNGNQVRPGQVLAVLFGNPDHALKKGDRILLRFGDWEVAGLSIQG